MKKATVVKVFLRSFLIHSALNFRRMQNLGFAMALIPLIREWRDQQKDIEEILFRHLQMFNTHPYFSSPVIGSIVRLEEDSAKRGVLTDTTAVKQSLMGPYAAIGDTFFWGALRPFAAIIAVVLAYKGLIIAPLVFLLIFTPAHIWIRLNGFIQGLKHGKQGIEFIRIMDLPLVAAKIRWLLLLVLACSVLWLSVTGILPIINAAGLLVKLMILSTILICFWLIIKGVSQVYILYGACVIFLFIAWKDILN